MNIILRYIDENVNHLRCLQQYNIILGDGIYPFRNLGFVECIEDRKANTEGTGFLLCQSFNVEADLVHEGSRHWFHFCLKPQLFVFFSGRFEFHLCFGQGKNNVHYTQRKENMQNGSV